MKIKRITGKWRPRGFIKNENEKDYWNIKRRGFTGILRWKGLLEY